MSVTKFPPTSRAREIVAGIERAADRPKGKNFLTEEQRSAARAKAMTDGLIESAALVYSFSGSDVQTEHVRDWMTEAASDVHNGDLKRAETLLISQSLALNSIFGHYAREAASAGYVDKAERLMRMALRAQNQSRMTLETLATIKNPLNGAYVRQANVAGGHQQVNNGTPPTRTHESRPAQIEQSRGLFDEKSLDRRAPKAASSRYQEVATVGEVNGTAYKGRKTEVSTERRQGRRVEV